MSPPESRDEAELKNFFKFLLNIELDEFNVLRDLLLMAEILHHLGCIKPYNSGINYLSIGAGFLPSTVVSSVLQKTVVWALKFYLRTVVPKSLAEIMMLAREG